MAQAKAGRPSTRKAVKQDDRPQRAALVVQLPTTTASPDPSPGWLPEIVTAWDAFWASDVAGAVDDASMPAIRRLFDLRSRQAAAFSLYDAEPYVVGSTGQPRINPAFDAAMKLETAITALEDRYGLTSKAKVNLGLAFGQAQLTAADLNRMAAEVAHGGDIIEDAEVVEGWEAG